MNVNLADLVAAVAAALPDRDAVVCDGDRLTYAEAWPAPRRSPSA